MMEELLGHHSDPFADLPFVMGGTIPMTSSLAPTAGVPDDAQTLHEEEIIAEINAEMEAAARGSDFGGGMDGPSPAPLRMISLGGTVIETSAPAPLPSVDPVPPTPPAGSIPIHLSSEDEVDIMPPTGDRPPKGKGSKRKLSGSSSGSTPKGKPKKKKELHASLVKF